MTRCGVGTSREGGVTFERSGEANVGRMRPSAGQVWEFSDSLPRAEPQLTLRPARDGWLLLNLANGCLWVARSLGDSDVWRRVL